MAKNNINNWSLALLRVVLGIIFLYHGYVKLFAPGGFTGTVKMVAGLGFPMPAFFALAVSAVEFFGGLFLLLGILTKWSSLLLIADMLVALFKVHLKNGLLVSKGGYEFVLILLAALFVILVNGAGRLSFGKNFKNKNLK